MSSSPKISFTRPGQSQSFAQSSNPQNQYSANVPPNHQSNFYQVRQTNVLQSNASPVDLSQKPATIFVGRPPVAQEVPRPQYEQTYNRSAQSKRLGPPNDPPPKLTCCTPIWWYIAVALGLVGLILSLLFGLNVIGGGVPQRVASIAASRSSNKTQNTTATSNTTNTSAHNYNTSSTGAPTSSSTSPTTTNTGASVPASIPAQTVTTTTTVSTAPTHHSASLTQNSLPPVDMNRQHRHRLPVEQGQQDR